MKVLLRVYSYLSLLGDERHRRAVLLCLLAVAFVLRLAAALIVPIDYRLRDDAVEYVSDARHLLTLGVFGEEPGIPYAIIPPGYPLFIAAIFALTNQSLMAVRLAQVVLGTLMVWLTYLIGREITPRYAGLLGAFISALYPAWIMWVVVFMIEALYTVLLLAFTWCFIRSLQTYTVKYTILTGVTFGLSLLTREVLLIFPLAFPLAFWWSRISWRHAWRYLLLFIIVALLTLSPWLARNYHTFGQVFYTERTESIRYQLTGSGYLSAYYKHLADENIPPPPPNKPPDFYERYGSPSEWISVNYLLTNPTTYLYHLGHRLVEVWLHPNGLESLPDNLVVRSIYIALHICMLVLAGVSVVAGLKRRDVIIGIFTLLLVYVTGMSLFFTAPNPRYTLPSLPLIFILSALGLGSVWQYLRRRGTIDVSIARRV
jgi:4-amino-4-deoxy-L-arabinose transferase-like glycosyltransferase